MPAIDVNKLEISAGRPYPLGCIVMDHAIRFTIFSRHARQVWLALFNAVNDTEPACEIALDPRKHRVGDIWSVFVRGLESGVYYKYRMDGPNDPKRGHRFNPKIYLLDPYAKAFVGDVHDGTIKCVAVNDYMDWNHDPRPRAPMTQSIIYETHVRGLTIHPSAGVAHPGTYRGVVEKIPYFKELGITAIELLPVQEFGETMLGRCSLDGAVELTNYWGYSNIGFFAPAARYACAAACREHLDEFRDMVRALHQNGIEIILDVVFNHTSEGGADGPTLAFRGIDNAVYYLLGPDGAYLNYSGCGNTLNCNHPLVRDFILDCLRYWVAVMHVDGFRFDLASILGRGEDGNIQQDAPLIQRISEDPVLRDTKLIAEAWDAGGAYQVGSFGGVRWAEWNGRYRDDVRRYWRGDPGTRGAFASRLAGSADLYQHAGRTPESSINFVTCHDGFTLRDLVSYREKHNWANGEGNRDGAAENFSMNCGVEGDTDDPAILALRLRLQKNFMATLFLSLGVPMLLGGDEFGRTQRGNNNAYCQDNEISWYDWRLLEKNAELFRFVKALIAFRRANPVFMRNAFYQESGPQGGPIAQWFDHDGGPVNWFAADTTLGCKIHAPENAHSPFCLLFNNTDREVVFRLPAGHWRTCVDTGQPAPLDCPGADHAPFSLHEHALAPRSMAVLAQPLNGVA
jgi:glycogen operon protein